MRRGKETLVGRLTLTTGITSLILLSFVSHRSWVGQLGRPDGMKDFVLLYNSIRLVVSLSSTVLLSSVLLAQKYMVIGLVILCVYSAVRLHGFLTLNLSIMGLILGVFLTLLFSTLAETHDLSRAIKSEMKRKGLCHKASYKNYVWGSTRNL